MAVVLRAVLSTVPALTRLAARVTRRGSGTRREVAKVIERSQGPPPKLSLEVHMVAAELLPATTSVAACQPDMFPLAQFR